jgi:hypothetical protein
MPSTTIVLIDKTGSIKELAVKEYKEEDLYKKAGFKSAENFTCAATWSPVTLSATAKTYHISVYGKKTGKAGQENKYDFPPPIDTTLFFGTCVLVNKVGGNATNLTSGEWTAIYEHLFGGFEDIGAADSEEEASTDENDEYAMMEKTKSGYAKGDGFVVSDNESDDDYIEVSSASSEEKKKKKPVAKKSAAKTAATKKTTPAATTTTQPIPTNIFVQTVQSSQYLDCTSELTEEEYV